MTFDSVWYFLVKWTVNVSVNQCCPAFAGSSLIWVTLFANILITVLIEAGTSVCCGHWDTKTEDQLVRGTVVCFSPIFSSQSEMVWVVQSIVLQQKKEKSNTKPSCTHIKQLLKNRGGGGGTSPLKLCGRAHWESVGVKFVCVVFKWHFSTHTSAHTTVRWSMPKDHCSVNPNPVPCCSEKHACTQPVAVNDLFVGCYRAVHLPLLSIQYWHSWCQLDLFKKGGVGQKK